MRLDPVRAEALRAAVTICTPGNYENVGRRLLGTLDCADALEAYLRHGMPPVHTDEAAVAASGVRQREAG